MPPYFFLSYADADEGPAVQKFFRDLSVATRVREKLPDTEIVGCSGVERFENREEGLQTSRTMLALISSNYLSDHAAECDWHTFQQRKARITRINWLRHPGPLPKAVAAAPVFPHQLDGNGYAPLAVMIASIGKYKALYDEFVDNLADYIIDSAASPRLPEVASILDEVRNTLKEPEEPDMKSQPTNLPQDEKINHHHKIVNKNKLVIDGTFVKELAEQIKETPRTPAPVSPVGPSGQITQPTKADNEKYVVFTIADKPEDIRKIEIPARLSPFFDVKPYTDRSKFLDDIVKLLDDHKGQEPDLIVLNPSLIDPLTHNYTLIKALLDKKVPSAILATSKDPDAARWIKQARINDLVTVLPESSSPVELLQMMRYWAKLGRDKRYNRGRSDERPVFLSFASQDQPMASQICKWLELRQIGVWYSYETLKPGDEWIEKIKQGLASAEVFVALISDHYHKSDYCQGELGNILVRMANESAPPRIIPVHYHQPTEALEDLQIKTYVNQQAVEIPSDMEWLVGCGKILESVQHSLKPRQN